MVEKRAEEIFTAFKEHSIAEFFKKNRQMLGYSGKVRSLVTVVHEFVTNSLDACEDAGILPSIRVEAAAMGEERYRITVTDNGPGIPRGYVGKALATILAGTKFHRYVQQRGQQGIGAAGCTLFSQVTTGKQILASSFTGTGKPYSCRISIDTVKNRPVVSEMVDLEAFPRGLRVEGEFADVKYENSDHGILEYIKRTALSNPHTEITFVDPEGREHMFPRSVDLVPERPSPAKPHPLGLSVNDLLEYSKACKSSKISSFLVDTFARTSQNKVNELRELCPGVDFGKDPRQMNWDEAEALIKAFGQVKWIVPESAHIKPIGKPQIELAMRNIFDPEFMNVVERRPAILKGGIPFIVEAAAAFGGNSGKRVDGAYEGTIMRFANRVPLLFDSGTCAITTAVRSIDWKRYRIDMERQPISLFVNVSSVHIPYSGVGKESIAQEEEVIDEIRLAVMEAARGIQRYVGGKMRMDSEANRYKAIMRYARQLSLDLGGLTGESPERLEKEIESLTKKRFPKLSEEADDVAQQEPATEPEGEEDEGGASPLA